MATINSKKLLPGGEKKEVFLVPTKSIVPAAPKLDGVKPSEKKATKSSPEIEGKVIQVTELFNNNLLLKAADRERKRKEEERKEFEEREKKLEEKKLGKKGQQESLVSKIPGSSLFDRLARFTGFTLLGFVFNNYSNLLPRLTALGAILKPAAEGFGYFAEGILSGTIDWIEKGYKAYDTVRDWTKQLGGENFQKLFDDFSGALNLLINGAIIAGAAGIRGGLFIPKKGILPRAIKAGESAGGGLSAAGGTAAAGARMRALQEKAKESVGKRALKREQRAYEALNVKARLDASRSFRMDQMESEKRGSNKRSPSQERTDNISKIAKKIMGKKDASTLSGRLARQEYVNDLVKAINEDTALLSKEYSAEDLVKARIQRGLNLKTKPKTKKQPLSFEDAAKIKPYGYNPEKIFYSSTYQSGYVNFRYAGTTKRMTLSEAKYLQTMIESAEAAEIINLPQAESQRKIANEIFQNPKRYSKQIRDFEGLGIDSESRMITRRRKLTAENVAPRGPRLPTGTTQATQSIAKGASKGAARAAASRGTRLIPFIGPLLDLAISIALGDPPDEAIVGAIGSSLGAFVGAALIGSGTFGIGAILGGAVGGFVGDLIARSLYNAAKNMFFDKKKKEVRGFAQGGVVDPRRQIKATQKKKDDYEREREPMPTPTRMGYFSEILNEIYGKTDGKVTLGIIQSASSELKKVATYSGFLASLMGGTMDLLLGQPFDGGLLRYIGKKYGRQTESAVRSAGDAVIRRLKMIYSEKTGKEGGDLTGGGGGDVFAPLREPKRSDYPMGRGGAKAFQNALKRYQSEKAKRAQAQPQTPTLPSVSGGFIDTGYKDSEGRPIKLKGSAAAKFIEMAEAAKKQGIDIGPGISNAFRDPEHNKRVGGAAGSKHLSGLAFDINWYSEAGGWILRNASKYNFEFLDYPGSTHFNYKGNGDKTKPATTPSSPELGPQSSTKKDDAQKVAMNTSYYGTDQILVVNRTVIRTLVG